MAQTPKGIPKQKAKRLEISLEEFLQKDGEGLKRCTKCKTWKLKAEFGKDKSRGDGLNPTCVECKRVKEKKILKGRVSAFKGKKHSLESRQKMCVAQTGNSNRLGKPHTEEAKRKMRAVQRLLSPRGSASHSWRGGTAAKRKQEQEGFRYRDWRKAVFSRDRYTCQHCGDSRGGNLQAHHIKPWSKYPELRFEISNGLTLCQSCHEKIHLKPIPTKTNLRRRRKHGAQ